MKVFNPQSTQAGAIFDLAIVVIAVLVVIFAVVVGITREDRGTSRQLLVSDSGRKGSFLTAAQKKNNNETTTKRGA